MTPSTTIVVIELTRLLDGLSLWQATVVVLGISIVGAVIIEVVGMRLVRFAVTRTESQIDDILFQELRIPVIVSITLAGVFVLTQTPVVIERFTAQNQLDFFFGKPSLSIIVLVWAWSLNRIVNRVVAEIQDIGDRYDFAPVFSNVWTLVVIASGGFLLLSIWGIQLTPLLGAAGVAGIAIGFAAKDTVANFFGGLALYFDNTYKLGDYVVLESGDAGTVVKIGVRSTTLRTRSEELVTVPNSMLNAGRVINQSAPQHRKRIQIPIGVAYGTDIDVFENLILELADDEPLVLETPRPRMRFRGFGDFSLQYELLCWVATPMQESRTKHELNREIYKAMAAAEIEIPYPKRDVTVNAGPSASISPMSEPSDHGNPAR